MRGNRAVKVATVERAWTPSEDRVARLLAIGYTQEMAADELGMARRTVQNYCAKPGFYEYVKHLSLLAWERVEPSLMANMELALDVQRQVLLGKLDAKDNRYIEARALIQVLIRFLQVATRKTDDGEVEAGTPASVIDVTPERPGVNGNGVHPS